MKSRDQAGFIALISVILIAFLLMTFAVSVNLSGFLGRYNQLDSEIKEQGASSAEACVNKAIVDIGIGNVATGTISFGNNLYSCTTQSVAANTPIAGESTIKAQGIYKNSYTNLVVVLDSATQAVLSWREFATIP